MASRSSGIYQSAAYDASGNGEGELCLGSSVVVLSGSPKASENISVTLAVTAAGGGVVTATDASSNTSEFSTFIPLAAPSALIFKDGYE